MAKSFKSLLGDDIKNTRTLLHEAIPVTGTISSGTYSDNNIKTFSHGMYDSVYDYPYLSSSANHIFDLSYGVSSNASSSANVQNAKKLNIYNQMAQVLMGYDLSGSIKKFDSDGNIGSVASDGTSSMDQCFFMNFSRLLVKDEIKKNSFRLTLAASGNVSIKPTNSATTNPHTLITLGDYDAGNEFRTSPAGDYGLIFSASGDSTDNNKSVGLLFYQAGVAVLTSSIFRCGSGLAAEWDDGNCEFGTGASSLVPGTSSIDVVQTGSSISAIVDGFRNRLSNIQQSISVGLIIMSLIIVPTQLM